MMAHAEIKAICCGTVLARNHVKSYFNFAIFCTHMAQLGVMRMLKFSSVFMFTSVSSCYSTINKRKCRTVEQSLSVLKSMNDISVRKWQ